MAVQIYRWLEKAPTWRTDQFASIGVGTWAALLDLAAAHGWQRPQGDDFQVEHGRLDDEGAAQLAAALATVEGTPAPLDRLDAQFLPDLVIWLEKGAFHYS